MKHFRRNATYNVLGWLLPTVVFLALTPVLIRKLGVEAFGVVALIQVITGYMNVLNFGFSEAIIKQVAACHERDPQQAQRVAWVGFKLFLAFGLMGALVLALLAHWLAFHILKVDASLRQATATSLYIGAAIFGFQMLAEFYRGVAMGCNRFDIPNVSRMLRVSLSAIFMLAALALDLGVVGVIGATLAGLLIGLIVNAIWMERLLPLRNVGGDTAGIRKEVLHYSKHVFAMRLAGALSSNLSQLFLGALSSAAHVALYQVPVRAAETGSVFLNRVLQVFHPAFASMDLEAQRERIKSVFLSAFALQAFLTTPFFLIIAVEGENLLRAWIGQEFANAAGGIIVLVCAAFWLSSLTNLPTFLALSFNAPGLLSAASIVRLVVVVAAGYPLIKSMGLEGAAWLLLLGEIPAIPFIVLVLRRTLGKGVVAQAMAPVAIHAALAVAGYLAYQHWWRDNVWYSPWLMPAALLIYIALALAARTLPKVARTRLLAALSRT